MYNILKFVWELPTYQTSIKVLTAEAINYDGSEQEIPILLRFINMMINDATVQLDEGLEVGVAAKGVVWGGAKGEVWPLGYELQFVCTQGPAKWHLPVE